MPPSLSFSVKKMYQDEGWAQTDLRTPIALYASGPLGELARPIILIGGVHGDEPLGVQLAKKTLEHLQKEHATLAVPWIVIPCLNPDGFKNNTRVNGRGVDLNRNYPAKDWDQSFEKSRYYPGPTPASEAEIKALTKLISFTQPRLLIHCHSWKPMIVCAGFPGRGDAEHLSRASGYAVVDEIGYPTPGSLSQYGWIDHQIPVICIEEADETPHDQVWPNFESGLRAIFLDASPREITRRL